jgi:hypothetical protein
MSWYTLFYLFSILDKLSAAFMTGAVLSTIAFVVLTITWFVNKDRLTNHNKEDGEHWLKVIRWPLRTVIFLGIIFWLLVILVPTRKDMIIIIAGGAVGEFVTSDSSAQKLPADITRFLRAEILKATAELSDEAKASIGIDVEAEKIKKLSREELEKLVKDNNILDKPQSK